LNISKFKEDLKNTVLNKKHKINKTDKSKEIYIEKENPILNDKTSISTNENITLNENRDIIHLNKEEKFPFNLRNLEELLIEESDIKDEDNIRKGIIEKYIIDIIQEIEIKKSIKPDKETINSINDFTKNIIFKKYDSIKSKFIQSENKIKINENIEPQLRNLEIASFFTPVQFSYSLFKLDLAKTDAVVGPFVVSTRPFTRTSCVKITA
jgi:hypothetical protein